LDAVAFADHYFAADRRVSGSPWADDFLRLATTHSDPRWFGRDLLAANVARGGSKTTTAAHILPFAWACLAGKRRIGVLTKTGPQATWLAKAWARSVWSGGLLAAAYGLADWRSFPVGRRGYVCGGMMDGAPCFFHAIPATRPLPRGIARFDGLVVDDVVIRRGLTLPDVLQLADPGAVCVVGTTDEPDGLLAAALARPTTLALVQPALDPQGTLAWPARWSSDDLRRAHERLGPAAFTSEFLSEPLP
jgi:hypothetical protein